MIGIMITMEQNDAQLKQGSQEGKPGLKKKHGESSKFEYRLFNSHRTFFRIHMLYIESEFAQYLLCLGFTFGMSLYT